jgi:putative redox protein
MTDQAGDGAAGRLAVVTRDGGLRFTAALRGHSVPTDQPRHAGGDDSAVTPLELLAASLGACITLYAHKFFAAREVDDAGLGVEVQYATATAPKRISRFDVDVRLPDGFPDRYRTAFERAVLTCPVHNTLAHPPEINCRIVAGEQLAGLAHGG